MENSGKLKILIGGGAGYIGSRLIPELVEHGYEVTAIDMLWFGNYLPEGVKVIQKDLFEVDAQDMAGFDQFIFLGGLSNDPMAEFSPAKNFIHNAALPAYLAYEAKRAGVKRYIYASSCSVYGYTVNQLYDEDSPVTCAYPYGISKLQGERGVFQMCSEDFSCISLRQGTVCGPSPRMRYDLMVNTMFKFAMTEGRIIINNPSIWRPLFDIRDTVSAYLRAIQADETISGVFNVSSGNYTIGQVGDLVKRELEQLTAKTIKLEIKNVKDFRNYKVSTKLAETTLGFTPLGGVQSIVRDLHANLDKANDFSNEAYYNISVFKKLQI